LDNLTHSLFGATLARTPLGRAGRGTTLALVLASNAPDIDIVAAAGGSMRYLEWHRGPTHGPLGIVGLGVVAAGLAWAAGRAVDKHPHEPRASFGALTLVSTVGVFMHVMMDLPTTYGTRALSPFDWRWFALDWMPIIDVYLLIALAGGLLFGNRSETRRRRAAAIVLAVMALNYGVRGTAHHQAIAAAPRVFGALLPEWCEGAPLPPMLVDRWPRPMNAPLTPSGRRCLIELAAIPTFVSPFHWRAIAHLSNGYELGEVSLLAPGIGRDRAQGEPMDRIGVGYPNHWTPAVTRAADTRVAQVFLGFSRFPAVRSFVEPDGSVVVHWVDVRFSIAPVRRDRPPSRRDGLFTATVRLSRDGKVVEGRLGS
jgi:inner membrane protein